jgi:hypothetical protein
MGSRMSTAHIPTVLELPEYQRLAAEIEARHVELAATPPGSPEALEIVRRLGLAIRRRAELRIAHGAALSHYGAGSDSLAR